MEFQCFINNSKSKSYDFRIGFFKDSQLMFHLLVNKTFTIYDLVLDEGGYDLGWKYTYLVEKNCNCHILEFPYTVTFGSRNFINENHPYIVIKKNL